MTNGLVFLKEVVIRVGIPPQEASRYTAITSDFL